MGDKVALADEACVTLAAADAALLGVMAALVGAKTAARDVAKIAARLCTHIRLVACVPPFVHLERRRVSGAIGAVGIGAGIRALVGVCAFVAYQAGFVTGGG